MVCLKFKCGTPFLLLKDNKFIVIIIFVSFMGGVFLAFFDILYKLDIVQQAFKMVVLDKMLNEGYIDMSTYIGQGINKEKMHSILEKENSKYTSLYDKTISYKNSVEELSNSIKYKKIGNSSQLTYKEASAIVNLVYKTLKKSDEKIDFTKEIFKGIRELKKISNDIGISKNVFYNKNKVKLQFISSVSSISNILNKLKNKEEQTIFFRGHSNCNYILRPSIMRNDILKDNEETIYNELLINCPDEFKNCNTHLDKLVKMQHYGLPTRLLDITRNFLVALFFACESQTNSYGELVLLGVKKEDIKYPQSDTASILASLPILNKETRNKFRGIAKNDKISDEQFNDEVKRLIHIIRLEKPSFKPEIAKNDVLNSHIVYALKKNNRIVKQDGAFILCGLRDDAGFLEKFRYEEDEKKLIILIKDKQKILNQLEDFSINRATLFPEIECVSEYIKNKYMY